MGPFWGGQESTIAGRYPLSVERHVMAQVDRMLAGVTAVAPHARYYMLHALVAHEVKRRGLVAAEAQRLLRRAEVVMGAISLAHGEHPGLSYAHGVDQIQDFVDEGSVDVAGLAEPGGYAQSSWGFWGPYRASEELLGLTTWQDSNLATGPKADPGVLYEGLGPILELADQDVLDVATLQDHSELCLCRCATAADGELFRSLFVPADVDPASHGGRRGGSVRLMLRIFQTHEISAMTRDVTRVLGFSPELGEDPVCSRLEVTDPWRGIVLRNQSVNAWRRLWPALEGLVEPLMSIPRLADRFADELPATTLHAYLDALPDSMRGNLPLPAELDASVAEERNPIDQSLAILMIGASRAGRLPERVAEYFQPKREGSPELSPAWLSDRIVEWQGRSLRDFASWLTGVLVTRSQRIALRKARFHRGTGVFTIPTRLLVRDGLLFSQSIGGSSPIGYRWGTLSSVLAGAGYSEFMFDDDAPPGRWRVTERGEALLA